MGTFDHRVRYCLGLKSKNYYDAFAWINGRYISADEEKIISILHAGIVTEGSWFWKKYIPYIIFKVIKESS